MRILITGGTGSLGVNLTKTLLSLGHDVSVYSRDPHKQVEMKRRFPRVRFYLGDVRDSSRLSVAMRDCSFLVHAAAIKHVSLGEDAMSSSEVADINAHGSRVVAETWDGRGGAILISTDKAVAPCNLYGASKMIAEYEFTSRGYSAVRYGNVVSSRGSFIHKWLQNPSSIVVRTPFPTRFFMTMDDAVSLVMGVMSIDGSGVYVPLNVKSFAIDDMAALISSDFSTEPLGSGEKRHERLIDTMDTVNPVTDDIGHVVRGSGGLMRMHSSGHVSNLIPASVVLDCLRGEVNASNS